MNERKFLITFNIQVNFLIEVNAVVIIAKRMVLYNKIQ